MLPQKFQDTPAQALRAYLSLDLPDNAKRWTLQTYQAMAEAVFLRRHQVLIKVRRELLDGGDLWESPSPEAAPGADGDGKKKYPFVCHFTFGAHGP